MKLTKFIVAAGVIFLMAGCGDLIEEAKAAIAAAKADQATESDECQNYKDQYLRTDDSTYKELYEKECQDNFVSENTPAELDEACQVKYETMLLATDSIVLSSGGDCNPDNLSTECEQASTDIKELADTFAEECEIEEFYYVSIEEGQFETQLTEDGKCFWNAWVPEETRQPEQSANVDVYCQETVECVNEQVNGFNRFIEVWDAVDGDKVFLPCAKQYESNCAPDQAMFWDDTEQKDVCVPQASVPHCPPPTFPVLDAGELGCVDPCDTDGDGEVSTTEEEGCVIQGCLAGEFMIWDPATATDVCISDANAPECAPPGFIEMEGDKAVCRNPCDKDADGTVSATEKESCGFEVCDAGQIPMWDETLNKEVCVTGEACAPPTFPELIDGKAVCIDPCDHDRNGTVDATELQNCNFVACAEGEQPAWDPVTNSDVCVKSDCQPPQHPELDSSGTVTCVEGSPGPDPKCIEGEIGVWDMATSSIECVPATGTPLGCTPPDRPVKDATGNIACGDPTTDPNFCTTMPEAPECKLAGL